MPSLGEQSSGPAMPAADRAIPDRAAEPPVPVTVSPGYQRYVLALMCTVYLFNFIDRQVVVILAEPLRREFGLSDAQLGLLSGFAFALVYSTLGVPVAHLADRTSRKLVIGVSLAFWSVMTALGGLATGFGTLALARAGVGVGEAGCSPAATSLLSDYFPPRRRAWANAVYSASIYGGYLIGFVAGGVISQYFGWRWAFVVVGLPGVLLSLLLAFTLREPPRGLGEGRATARSAERTPLLQALQGLWAGRAFRWIIVASSLHAFATLGVNGFMPAFLARSHHMGQAAIGTWLGLITGISGILGTVAGGYLADRFGARDRGRMLWICALSVVASVPFSFVSYLHPHTATALIAFIPATLLGVMYLGPALTVLQELAGAGLRALSVSVFYLFNNLLGLGAGAFITGLISDRLAPSVGSDSLRYALCIMVSVNLISFACYVLATRALGAARMRST